MFRTIPASKQKNIDPLSTIVRVAAKSGQGFLNVTLNVLNPSDKTSNQPDFDDAGVKRCFIVAIATIKQRLTPASSYTVAIFQVMLENIVVCRVKERVFGCWRKTNTWFSCLPLQ